MRNTLIASGAVIAAASLALTLPATAQTSTAAPSSGAATAPGASVAPGASIPQVLAPGVQRDRARGGFRRKSRAGMHKHDWVSDSADSRGRDAAESGVSGRTELDSMDSTALGGLGDTRSRASTWSSPGGFSSPFPKGPAAGPWSGR